MGIRLMGTSFCSCESERVVVKNGNPDPSKFKIILIEQVKCCVIACIEYQGCTNYEGKKILVFRNCKVDDIMALNAIDPHFCEGGHISPVARFEPTPRGWSMANSLVNNYYD